ncbi:MAG: peptide ABC transporter substrate-binding protein [Oscillospiraceae bacterium]|nr:peptide ABC transporter substrate-binding protein [Oscillospiraceae bacterium]
MKKRALALFLACGMLLGLLAGCGTYQDSGTPSSPANSPNNTAGSGEPDSTATVSSDFTMAYNGIVTLNPIMSQSSNDVNVFYLTQIQLVRYYGDQVQMDAAERFDTNDDYTVYTFHLRDGLTWSDGQPITAADFEYAAYCLLNPDMGSPAAYSWFAIKNSSAYNSGEVTDWADVGVKALDDKTIEFTLERPLSTFEKTIAVKGLYPLRQDFVERVGSDKLGSSVDTILFSGPYVITDWVLESTMELKKNDLYWDSANSFPTQNLHFVEVEDANTKVAMFENGEVDAIEQVASQYYDHLSDYLYSYTGGGFMLLWFNQLGTNEEAARLLSNQNFRQALNYGFDRAATVAAVNPVASPSSRLVSAAFPAPNGGKFVDEYPVNSAPLAGDVDKAKEYLDKALEELNYSDVSELPELTLITWDASSQKLLLETVIDQWKQNLGINNIQLNQYVIGTAIGAFYTLDYDIFCITWETDVLPTDIMEAMMTGGEVNYGIWSDPEFDSLVQQAVSELDPVKQAELTSQAEQVFADNAAILPMYENGNASAVQSYVDGFQMTAISSGYQFNQLVVHK